MGTFGKEDWLALWDCIPNLTGPIIKILKEIGN